MDLQKIKALIDLLADSPLAKLEVIEGDERVKLVKAKRRGKRGRHGAAMAPAVGRPGSDPVSDGTEHATDASAAQDTKRRAANAEPRFVCAPMFGIVHLTPSPGEAPFVKVGDAVAEGQVLCTIEAMKMFNAIECDCAGTVSEVLVTPGSEVESGQPLFRIG
ncbi:acetyl-CoA carboxylase biotin carboxyl carrier protein [Trinickia dinghuensis]|uniref:Biotin carboxyl carrier protein of acetyl-CoA carboxylase n=1 Tax=Trinickia dinghuensis TaxID=2291023 RepID=A0A3D8K581_9BURK|nr:acetyl-CoA carboxylase biotin carboxyl carrier protein [Trinickia dinghuensis]RDV00371.1 acetyl-CoA carboxylase biotin carboxyl carrier protein [Trinickia dinghuensis]